MSTSKRSCAVLLVIAMVLGVAACGASGGGVGDAHLGVPQPDSGSGGGGNGNGAATTAASAAGPTTPPATAAATTEVPTAEPTPQPATTAAPTPPAVDAFVADIFWYTYADTYLSQVRGAMEAYLDAAPGIDYAMADCESDQARQTQMVEDALARGADLLIVNIVQTGSEEAAQDICDMAKSAGVPIVFFNREVGDSVVNSYDRCCFVGTDANEAGYMQGQAVAEYLLEGGNLAKCDLDGDKQIKYVMFRGESGCSGEAYGRTKYSVQEANRLLEGSGYKLAPSPANAVSAQYDDDGISNYFLYGNWSAAEAANLMRGALSEHRLDDGAIELVIANNDDQAIGAIEAMNELGYNTGAEDAGYIPTFGVDATDVAQDAIAAGKMTATVLQDADGLAECIALLAANAADGQNLMSDTGRFTNIDAGAPKIRIPYVIIKQRS